jgi:hypothetical protein
VAQLSRDGAGIFVGREPEHEALRAALQQLAAGRGQLFLIAGNAGTGKTRLADELAGEAAARGVQVLWGRCWDGGGAPPYWPWVQIVRGHLREHERESVITDLGTGAADIAAVVPEIHELLPELTPPTSYEGDEARFRLFDSFAAFFTAMAAREPLLLILDDVHAADMPSLLLLRFIARGVHDVPLVVLALVREAEVGQTPGLAEMFGALAREGHHLVLQAFTEAEVKALAVQSGLETELGAAIHQATGGNPAFVIEVVQWLARDRDRPRGPHLLIPDSVREIVRWRLRARVQGQQAVHAGTVPEADPRPFESESEAERTPASRRLAYELGHLLGQPRDLEELLSLGTARCRELLDAEGVAVLLLDRARNELYFPYVAEEKPFVAARLRQARFPADRGFAGAALVGCALLRCDDVSRDPRFFPGVDELTGRTTRALLCAPLTDQRGAFGVLEAVNPRGGRFRDDDLSLLEAIAHTMAAAIARLPDRPETEPHRNIFRKEGDYWLIVHEGGEPLRIKDAKGLAYIAHLLRRPGEEVHAVDLVRACTRAANDDVPSAAASSDWGDGLQRTPSLGDAGEMLDAQARAAYRRRLDDARQELEDARACNDPGRTASAQHEIAMLTKELARAVGLGGRQRRAGSHIERARVNVTRAIALALKRIEAHPRLAGHLERTIKTGTFCAYVPDPRAPITWDA